MAIKSSTAREVDRLVAQLRDGSPVEREAAIARLRVIGARAIDRLGRLIRSDAPAAAHAAALKALEGVDDPRAREIAIENLDAEMPAVAAAAIATLDALSDLPRATILPVLQQVGGDDPTLAARASGEAAPTPFDQPSDIHEWLSLRGTSAALSEIHDAIVRIRTREREEPSARRRDEWLHARSAAHVALARRQSRVALYDLRETFDAAQGPLPLDLLAAVAMIGNTSCLEPLARAWSAGAQEPWWRERVAEATRAIAKREKLTARHAITKRIRARYPGLL